MVIREPLLEPTHLGIKIHVSKDKIKWNMHVVPEEYEEEDHKSSIQIEIEL